MRHKFKNCGSIQWAKLGLPYNSARTDFQCENCGVKFVHMYHIEPNIYQAIKNAGINFEDCPHIAPHKGDNNV